MQLRFNEGYSLKKIASEMGVSKNTAFREVKRAVERLEQWAAITEAVSECTVSDEVFMFDEFIELAPHAFPSSLRRIILTLYDSPTSEIRTNAALARRLECNYAQLSRQLGWIKAMCGLYGIPAGACHPLVQRSKHKDINTERAFESFSAYRRSNYGYYRKRGEE